MENNYRDHKIAMVVVVESMSITAFEKIGSPPDYTKSKTFPLLGSAKQ